MDKKAFRNLSYGLFLITSSDEEGRPVGCVANTFQQVGSEPAVVCVSLHKDNATTQAVRQSKCFGASVLSQSADMQLIGTFGFKSSRDIDKFAEIDFEVDARHIAHIKQHTNACFSVKVQEIVDAGSHLLFVGTVEDAKVLSDEPSMTYAYYHEVLRGKTPPKAVSYQKKEAQEAADVTPAPKGADAPKYGWRCLICGFVIEIDELPDDFVCPVCGVGKDMFERFEL